MSNPTELPDLAEAVRKLVKAKGRFHTEQNYKELADALARYDARRAQPEGEAPQAVAQVYLDMDSWMDVAISDLPTWERKGYTTRTLYPAATLSPLCGAQHAESGALDWPHAPGRDGAQDAPSAPGTPEAPQPPFPVSDEEMAALRRFWECASDGEGYDVEKTMMQRLAEMGLVQRKSGAYYMVTEFGLYVLREYTIPRAAQLDGGQEGSESNG